MTSNNNGKRMRQIDWMALASIPNSIGIISGFVVHAYTHSIQLMLEISLPQLVLAGILWAKVFLHPETKEANNRRVWICDNPQCSCKVKDEESAKMHEGTLGHTMTRCKVL